ncbi:hypothetical protein GALMADRAFT_245972 [Galerina marginata CBS 339.88]|uniref:MARVEL domain-containing protein n=1 Tax=Galerina marginata (strain CBS 339.88) TaxID=685588 RepID=A0A067T3H0_GALM3|nr:hypothetical protein GALMADRAFT_245972 [Galerina marginata CBS 339.88]
MAVNRTPFYSLALFTAVLQSVFGVLAGFVNGRSPYLYIFGKLAGGLSVVTWIWITILFRFNRKPESSHFLCRSYAHFASFTVFAIVWLAVGIMLATQMPWECGAKTLWCAAASFSSALAFCTSFFSLAAAIVIYKSSSTSGAGLSVNVSQIGKRELEMDYGAP